MPGSLTVTLIMLSWISAEERICGFIRLIMIMIDDNRMILIILATFYLVSFSATWQQDNQNNGFTDLC